MWPAPFPAAKTPLWQLTQLAAMPKWDSCVPPLSRGVPAPRTAPSAAVPELDAVSEPVSLRVAGGPTTVPTVVRVGVGAVAAFLFAAPPPQLFGLWQPLQS